MPTTTKSHQTAEQAEAASPTAAHEPVLAPLGGPTFTGGVGASFSGPPEGLDGLHEAAGNRAVAAVLESLGGAVVQRKCAACTAGGGTCAKCSAEDEMVRRSAPPGAPGASALPGPVIAALGGTGGSSLGGGTRAFMESRFGEPFGHVRVHADEMAAQAADSIGASAFTVGNSIWFGRGMYQPDAPAGLNLLAHELTHTIQQRGRTQTAQPSLRVGPVNDAAEATADRVAHAVMAGRPVSRIAPGRPIIRRKPKVSPVSGDPSRRTVEMDDGKRYRVKRIVDLQQKTITISKDVGPTFTPKIDKDNVWLQVDWCSSARKGDFRGRVKVGANLPGAAQGLLKDLGDVIINDKDPVEALRKAEIKPFASVNIAQSRRFAVDVSGGPTVQPGIGEVTGGKLEGVIKLPGLDVTVEARINKPPAGSPSSDPEWQILFGVKGTFGGPSKVECPSVKRTLVVPKIRYQCEEIVPEHEEERTRPITLRRSHYLYFEYAKSEFAKKGRTAALDKQAKAALKGSLDEGYRVNAIRGFASPEGPVEPTKRFQGNQKLSEERAEAAETWLNEACPPPSILSMRPGCFAEDYSKAGKGELYGTSAEGKELKGKELAETAVEAFKTEEAEEGRRTPDVKEELEKRKTPERQTDTVYPLLRRAEIDLSKAGTEKYKETVPETNKPLESCPPDVLRAAEGDFEREPAVKE